MSEKVRFRQEFLLKVDRDGIIRESRRMAKCRRRISTLPGSQGEEKPCFRREDGSHSPVDKELTRRTKIPHRNALRSNRLRTFEALHQLRQDRIEVSHQAKDVTGGCPITSESAVGCTTGSSYMNQEVSYQRRRSEEGVTQAGLISGIGGDQPRAGQLVQYRCRVT